MPIPADAYAHARLRLTPSVFHFHFVFIAAMPPHALLPSDAALAVCPLPPALLMLIFHVYPLCRH